MLMIYSSGLFVPPIESNLVRLLSPLFTSIFDAQTPNIPDRQSISATLACPSMGGALIATLTKSSLISIMPFALLLGLTNIAIMSEFPFRYKAANARIFLSKHIIRLRQSVQQYNRMSTNKNVCVIAIGMSGTGKTTFVNAFTQLNDNCFTINLDPAVHYLPYKPILDIRDTHDYRKVMKDHQLGPNGAILTALNLFTAQPEKIINQIEATIGSSPHEKNIFLVDIPGQIQVFTWSSSSLILTQAISLLMPVRILYVMDALRCQSPNVFLSNLLFAQSIHTRLQQYSFRVLLNKSDCADAAKLEGWVRDYEVFMGALQEDSSYLATLSKSIILHLSEFYEQLDYLCVSAKTGAGLQEVRDKLEG